MADQNIRHVKMWVDDRGGTYPKLTPEVYTAIVQEAHARKMTVHAHAIQLADQKAVVAAGADVLVHMVQNTPIDQEYLGLLQQKKPYWATVISLGDPGRSVQRGSVFRRGHARGGGRKDSRQSAARWTDGALRAAVTECGESRENARAELSDDDRRGREAGARDRYRDSSGSHLWIGRARRAGAMGAAWFAARAGDRRCHQDAGGVDGPQRSRHARRRQAGELHRVERQPARQHSQHPHDRGCLSRWREIRSRRGASQVRTP
jgi:hypothetical protein